LIGVMSVTSVTTPTVFDLGYFASSNGIIAASHVFGFVYCPDRSPQLFAPRVSEREPNIDMAAPKRPLSHHACFGCDLHHTQDACCNRQNTERARAVSARQRAGELDKSTVVVDRSGERAGDGRGASGLGVGARRRRSPPG
jgi:hypothetical protein